MLRVDSLALAYGPTPVLEGVSLEVPSGKFVSLVGPSGSGKSSLLRAVIGLQTPLAGTIETDIGAGDIGMLFQDDALLPWRTAEQNVALGLKLKGVATGTAIASARQWITRLGLYGLSERFPRELSGGQRKRVALARAIVLGPRIILYDEPTTGLDPIRSDVINQLILKLQRELNVTSITITHDMSSAFKIGDRIVMLYDGRLIFDGTPAQIQESDIPIVRHFISGEATEKELAILK